MKRNMANRFMVLSLLSWEIRNDHIAWDIPHFYIVDQVRRNVLAMCIGPAPLTGCRVRLEIGFFHREVAAIHIDLSRNDIHRRSRGCEYVIVSLVTDGNQPIGKSLPHVSIDQQSRLSWKQLHRVCV